MSRNKKLAPAKRIDHNDAMQRLDGWYSSLTGIGTTSWDKRMSVNYQTCVVTDTEARELWRGDDIAARIIELIPMEMFRKSFELKLQDKELAEDVLADAEELDFDGTYALAEMYERAYGGAAILPFINDGSPNLALPLNEDRISKINHFVVLEPRELWPVKWYTSGRKVGKPEVYELRPLLSGPSSSVGLPTMYIHESRMIMFYGRRVSREQPALAPQGFGDNELTRCNVVLRDFNLSWSSAGILVHDFAQAVFRMKGLAELVAMNRDDVVKMRMQAVELSRSVARALLIDSEEEFERKQTPLSGLPELLDRFATRLSAACGIPVTLLMGQSPAGLNATGASDIRFFYDNVAGHQKRISPQVQRGLYLLLRQVQGPTKGKEPKVWSHEWKPLWQQTEQEIAQARATQANTDVAYINAGVLSPEEVALNRFGGDTYSFDTFVDFKAREAMEAVAAPPAKTEQQIEEEEKQAEAQLAAMKKPGGDDGGGAPPDDDEPPEDDGTRQDKSVASIARELGMNPKKARARLRKEGVSSSDSAKVRRILRGDAYSPDQPRAENAEYDAANPPDQEDEDE